MPAPGKAQTRDDASDAITRLIAAVNLRKEELRLTQTELEERSGISQAELSNLLNKKKEPEWKLRKCSVLKRPERLASLCSVIGLDDHELLRDVCAVCDLEYEHVAALTTPHAVMGFCSSPLCHGATFVPQGRSALVVPFEKRIRGGRQQRCSWCGEELEVQCPRAQCRVPVSGGPICVSCGRPLVPCPSDLGNKAPEEVRRLCAERNEEHEWLRRLIRGSHDGPLR
jgi:hypothetical protein